jgi:hypothetical protein
LPLGALPTLAALRALFFRLTSADRAAAFDRRRWAIAATRRMLHTGQPFDGVFFTLRKGGCFMGDCVAALCESGMDIADAHRLVLNCDTWDDLYESTVELNEAMWTAMEQLGEAQPDGSIRFDLRDPGGDDRDVDGQRPAG